MRTASLALVSLLFACSPAFASFHLWQITKVYSNASGTVQYIELFTTSPDEEFVGGHTITSSNHSFTLPSNLPATPGHTTANQHFLLATPGYFALSGVPPADYNLGVNNFFRLNFDVINWAGVSTFSFDFGVLPLDGTHQLEKAFSSNNVFRSVNSPTNFAGTTGTISVPPVNPSSVPLPPSVILATIGLAAAALYVVARNYIPANSDRRLR